MSLTSLSVKEYLERVADGTPTPGGGGVCALVGGLGAALCLMTAHLTLGRQKYRSVWPEMQELSHSVTKLASRLLELTEQDSAAYDKLLSTFKLAQESEAQKKLRKESVQAATKEAAIVPLQTLRTMMELIEFVEPAIEKGNTNCLCDAAVAVQLIRAAAVGAEYNIRANLSSITDPDFLSRTRTEMIRLRNNIMQAVSRLEARALSLAGLAMTNIEESVEDYLEACAEFGKEPEKPLTGQFVVRVRPEVHRSAVLAAKIENKSLNAWVAEKLEQAACGQHCYEKKA